MMSGSTLTVLVLASLCAFGVTAPGVTAPPPRDCLRRFDLEDVLKEQPCYPGGHGNSNCNYCTLADEVPGLPLSGLICCPINPDESGKVTAQGDPAACAEGCCFDPPNCWDIDECKTGQYTCNEHATCVNKAPGYKCQCPAGFDESLDENDNIVCTDINECSSGTHNCDGTATCVNEVPGFDCQCPAGYNKMTNGDGIIVCTDIDECSDTATLCTPNGVCKDVDGSYTCTCNGGYELAPDGKCCVDIDECGGGSAPCGEVGTCTNTPGSYACWCPTGYTWNGEMCDDINECSGTDGSTLCKPNGVCKNEVGSYTCTCSGGYELAPDEKCCIDKDECSATPNPCSSVSDSMCVNTDGSSICQCNSGFVWAASLNQCQGQWQASDYGECEFADSCQGEQTRTYSCSQDSCYGDKPSDDSRLCIASVTGVWDTDDDWANILCSPSCGEGRKKYRDVTCKIDGMEVLDCQCNSATKPAIFQDCADSLCDSSDPCEPNPCQHCGICTPVGSDYKCDCTQNSYGFKGDKCEISPCADVDHHACTPEGHGCIFNNAGNSNCRPLKCTTTTPSK